MDAAELAVIAQVNRMSQANARRRENVNALRLGGPATPEGKAVSSRNALTHGLTARQTVIAGEDQSQFDALLASLNDDRKPEGELELQLTAEIAACMWRLARARGHEAKLLERAAFLYQDDAAQLNLVIRYSGAIERQLNRTIVRLEQIQAQRRKTAQFVSQTTENRQAAAAPETPPVEPPLAGPPRVRAAGAAGVVSLIADSQPQTIVVAGRAGNVCSENKDARSLVRR